MSSGTKARTNFQDDDTSQASRDPAGERGRLAVEDANRAERADERDLQVRAADGLGAGRNEPTAAALLGRS